jgi:hypothetical protein
MALPLKASGIAKGLCVARGSTTTTIRLLPANSLAPSVNVIAANDAGEILLAPSRAPALRDADT